MIVRGLILLLLVAVIPCSSLQCYECGCDLTDLTACDCGYFSDYTDNDYCVIYEQRYTDTTYIQLSRIPRNSTWVYIEDTYYILTQETIRYNLTTKDWSLKTTGIIFGCDWDLCNTPYLVNLLPNSFNLSIDKNWLTTNIYGNGSNSGCHQCSREQCGDTANPVNMTQCPFGPCINVTSCLVYDLWNNLETGDQCYQSQCAPSYLDGDTAELYGAKYRIDIEAIVYLAQNRSDYDIWELDVYCGAENCSRPTIFQEIAQQLSAQISVLPAFPSIRPTTTQPPPTTRPPLVNPITCYACECYGTGITTCPCAQTTNSTRDYTYCVIVRENIGQDVYIYSDFLELSATYMYIEEFPYALIEESIGYNEEARVWYTTTNFIIYGCNWNLCNKPELIPLLPDSFQMRLPTAWLNNNILGTGQPVRDCHECPEEVQCGTTEFLNGETCPIKPCNNTCLVLDVYDDPAYDYLCYQSLCLPPDTEDYQIEKHRIEIEGIVYASEQQKVRLWEVDIYCRADNCSRPEIFKELREQLYIQAGSLSALFNETHDPAIPQRRCYDCYCFGQPTCPCERTTIVQANTTYCLLVREDYGQDTWITMGHIDRESTRVYIQDFPYLTVEESILYNEQRKQWNTITNFVMYGCNYDYCNHPSLIPYLPNSFQMRLPEAWLNTNVLGTGQPVRECHECPDAPQCGTTDFLDPMRCPIQPCNTTCLVFDTFNNPADDLLCYQSLCAPPDTEDYQIETHRVEIEGILYLRKQPREIELWEVDIYCRADDCSRPEIFAELRSELTLQIGDLSVFESMIVTSATTQPAVTQTATTPGVGQTTTPRVGQTTTPGVGQTTTPGVGQTTQTGVGQTTTPGGGQTTTSSASILTTFKLFNIALVLILLFKSH